jgi:ComF family protein
MASDSAITWLRPLARQALDLLLPPNCLACDTPVDAEGQFCLACFRQATFISDVQCDRCGVPLPVGSADDPLCSGCLVRPPAFIQARAALRYDALSQRLILPLKYGDRTELARGLALLMARAGARLLAEAELLVPVPLHRARLRTRGYNQAGLLAASLGRIARRPVLPDALCRLRPTAPLASLGATARYAALDGSIALRERHLKRIVSRRILLIDDVLTSGATANACAVALLEAGAARVDVLVAARVSDPRLD